MADYHHGQTPLQPLPPPRPLHVDARQVSHARLRHRREIPLLILAGCITVGVFAYWIVLQVQDKEATGPMALVPVLIVFPFIAAWILRLQYWSVIGNAVEVHPGQFGDLYAQYVDLGREMGLAQLPRLYLANGNGALNAFASKCQVRKSFVVIYSDLLDLMYEHGDVNGVRFILAHELGHVKMGHVNIWRFLLNLIPNYLWIGRSVTRAQEYTADRVAMHYAPEGAPSMMALFAGKRLYRRVNVGEYFRSFDNHRVGFFGRMAMLLSTHPQGHRRMRALYEMHTKGLDHHGRMW
jgi:Zn-dependent protease with chaperone function